MGKPLFVFLWALPRTCSTAMTYSWASRSDTHVLDEPLYANYLKESNRMDLPGAKEVLEVQSADLEEMQKLMLTVPETLKDLDRPIVFSKNISKFFTTDDLNVDNPKAVEWLCSENVRNVFLVRPPKYVVRSFDKNISPTMSDIGLDTLVRMYELLDTHESAAKPLLVDSKLLLLDPQGVLERLCSELEIEFQESMLQWEKGPKPFDGVWAKHWYTNVWDSTSFGKFKPDNDRVPEPLEPLLCECEELYETVRFKALRRQPRRVYEGLHDGGSDSLLARAKTTSNPHDLLPDVRNRDIIVYVNGGLVKRDDARVSVFDSLVQGGDGVWEGLRVYEGRVFALDRHIKRMRESAKALAFANIPSAQEIRDIVIKTLEANDMRDGVHVRFTLSRGEKLTSTMNPEFNVFGCNLIVLAEYKDPVYGMTSKLITSTVRRCSPLFLDSKVHHNNLLNLIMAKIQANVAGVDDALMLDPEGFVSETNATNVFIVKDGRVRTPRADFCLPGITRKIVMELCEANDLPLDECRLSLVEVYVADEMFTTGTMGELSPVTWVDGRWIGEHGEAVAKGEVPIADAYPITTRLQRLYRRHWETVAEILPY